MIRDLNLYLKTQDASFELIDEAKIDVYKIDGLAQKMATAGGTSKITQRVQAANEIKNYINALVLDAKEDYQQKQMTFAGLADVMNQNRLGVAAALRIAYNTSANHGSNLLKSSSLERLTLIVPIHTIITDRRPIVIEISFLPKPSGDPI